MHVFCMHQFPCFELYQRVRGNSTCQTPSCCRISSPNPCSSTALLDRSPDDVYTPYVCNPSEVPLVRCWSSSASMTTRPWGRLHRSSSTMFVRECSHALGLQGYEYYHYSVTLQLRRIDHGLWAYKKIFFESQQWYQSWSMHSCLGTVRTHRGCGRWFSYCYPFICICSYLRHCWIASGLRPTLRLLLRETSSMTNIWLVSYMWLGGCQLLLFSGYDFSNGGPLAGFKETISESSLWLHARR
jgi:hypothetical protein